MRHCGEAGAQSGHPDAENLAMANARSTEIAWRECPASVDTAGVQTRAGSSQCARRLAMIPVAARACRSLRKRPHRCVTMFG